MGALAIATASSQFMEVGRPKVGGMASKLSVRTRSPGVEDGREIPSGIVAAVKRLANQRQTDRSLSSANPSIFFSAFQW